MAATVDRIPYPRLRDFVALALQRVGLPREDAATVAALMAEADLQGSDGHGVIRLAPYVKRIRAGGFNTRASIRVIAERPAMALLHGDNGMGHLVMKRAAAMAGRLPTQRAPAKDFYFRSAATRAMASHLLWGFSLAHSTAQLWVAK